MGYIILTARLPWIYGNVNCPCPRASPSDSGRFTAINPQHPCYNYNLSCSPFIHACILLYSAHVKTATYRGNAENYFHRAPSHKSRSKGPQPSDSAMENLNLAGDECDSDIPTKRTSRSEDKDTNILMIKFGALGKPCKVHTGDPVVCSNDQCAAILNYHSKIIKETGVEENVRFCMHDV